MKKTIILVLLFAFALSFCSCQSNSPVNKPDVGNRDVDTSSPEESENSVIVPAIDYFAEDGGVSKDWICPENSIY
ncbi:MAG: hypothetical protein J6W15_05420, partial [Clostridia bacterium]|nr:hypothetical protein [Clostridia bacterium]